MFQCLDSVKTIKPNPKSTQQKELTSNVNVQIYHAIDQLPDYCFNWLETTAPTNVFLERPFLTSLVKNPPQGMSFAYLVFTLNQECIGFAALQIKYFKASESLQFTNEGSALFRKVRAWLAKKVQYNTLICGSLLLTGENGYRFKTNVLQNKEQETQIITEALEFAKTEMAKSGTKIQAIFIKDFFDPHQFTQNRYNQFSVEPNMIMTIDPTWKTKQDYIAALASKYRVRTKRAFKKGEAIEKKEFNEERIIANLDKINALYRQIADEAAFNLFHLNDQYLLGLKQSLGENFRLFGYYLNGNLIAFYTTIRNGTTLDAHFLGYDQSLNHEYQIYLNMLYDMVEEAILGKYNKIVFARTASEIKSSVGAVPKEMYLYFRYERPLINQIIPYALKILSPREIWTPRNPFGVGNQ